MLEMSATNDRKATSPTPKSPTSPDRALTELSKQFEAHKLSDFPLPSAKSIISLKATDTLASALRTLTKYNILSAPVALTPGPGHDWSDNNTTCLSVLDIVAYVLTLITRTEHWGRGFEQVLELAEGLASKTVKDLLEKEECEPFLPLSVDSSYLDACILLGKYRIHRIPVVNKRDIVNYITQSQMIQVLQGIVAKDKLLAAHAAKSLESLGLAKGKRVLCVKSNDKAVDAFKIMRKENVSGIAVVDANSGALIGNISARDIRSLILKPEFLERMYSSAEEFLDSVHEEWKTDNLAVKELLRAGRTAVVSCRASDSLSSVVDRMCKYKIHRVFVVDERMKPIAVVSLADVIAAFVHEPTGEMTLIDFH